MYHYGYDGFGMWGGPSFLCMVIGLVVLIDLVLLGVWLWQKIRREEHDRHHHHNH